MASQRVGHDWAINTFTHVYSFSSVQLLSHVQLFATPWTAACQDSLSITNFQSLLKLISIKSVMPSNILCHPLLHPPSVFPSIRVFSESVLLIRWPKYSALASVLPMNIQDWSPLWLTGLISLQSKGFSRVFSNTTLPKALILWSWVFSTVQLSHPYMTTGKTIVVTLQTFVSEVVSLLFNTLSRFVIAFLPRS